MDESRDASCQKEDNRVAYDTLSLGQMLVGFTFQERMISAVPRIDPILKDGVWTSMSMKLTKSRHTLMVRGEDCAAVYKKSKKENERQFGKGNSAWKFPETDRWCGPLENETEGSFT